MSETMIRVEHLSKDYGRHRAVDDVSFNVHRGEVLGFLGPNGAGKTTTMRILTCFLAPTSGRAEVAGYDVATASLEVRRRIGYLPDDTPLYRDMTVYEYLGFIAEVRAIPPESRRTKIKEIVEVCGLGNVIGRQVAELSKGYRQRVGLAQAMIHDPEILVLDEPTSGLDPNQIVEIRSLIKRIGERKTVILSTHILPEVQATCGRVVIISDGRLVADGTPEELQSRESGASVRVEVRGPAAAVAAALQCIPGVRTVRSEPTAGDTAMLRVAFESGRDVRGDVFRAVVAGGWELLEMHREGASLEDIFRRLTTEEVRRPSPKQAAAA